jgi:excisionase family DNA binding protein
MSNLLTVKEDADLLGVSTKTIRRWEIDDKIKSISTTGNHRSFDISELLGNKKEVAEQLK